MEIQEAIAYLEKQHVSFKHLFQMASIFSRLDKNEWDDAIAHFHNVAGRFDYVLDRDFGALVLEAEADISQSNEIKCFLLHHALLRAEWCAQAASAGGELIARGRHVDQIDSKLAMYT